MRARAMLWTITQREPPGVGLAEVYRRTFVCRIVLVAAGKVSRTFCSTRWLLLPQAGRAWWRVAPPYCLAPRVALGSSEMGEVVSGRAGTAVLPGTGGADGTVDEQMSGARRRSAGHVVSAWPRATRPCLSERAGVTWTVATHRVREGARPWIAHAGSSSARAAHRATCAPCATRNSLPVPARPP